MDKRDRKKSVSNGPSNRKSAVKRSASFPSNATTRNPGNSGGDDGDEFPKTLGFPITSPVDSKLYKIIELENGLKAILISACSFYEEDKETVQKDRNCVDKRILEFNKNFMNTKWTGCCESCKCIDCQKDSDSCCQPQQSDECSTGDYEDDGAYISLSVGVGTFNDPPDSLGLAHFCEHMMCLGSENYPCTGESMNAATNGDTTRYFFDSVYEPDNFDKVLDMFSSIFIKPSLLSSQTQKEEMMVDSEFQEKRHNDFEKRMQILQNNGKPGHPICRFSWGTSESLHESNANLHTRVQNFYKNNYSAEHMTLAIQIPQPLQVIEELVYEYFSAIPNTGNPQLSLADQLFPYDTQEFRKYYSVSSIHDLDLFYITWELPADAWKNYKTKPMDYISRALNNKNKGGIIHYLRNGYMIAHMSASLGNSSHERTECSVLFSIMYKLTKLGSRNIPKILDSTFAYIKYLIANGPQEAFFRELQEIRALEFHLIDTKPVKDLDYALRHLPTEHVITGKSLPTTWDPDEIQKYFKLLIPSKANFMAISKSFENGDKIEPYFQTRYSVKDIPVKLLQRMENPTTSSSNFRAFVPNVFLPKNFCLVPDPTSEDELRQPTLVFREEMVEFWYFIDRNLESRNNYFLHFYTTLGFQSVENAAIMEVFIFIFYTALQPHFSGAIEAHAHYYFTRVAKGISFRFNGFSNKTADVLEILVKNIFNKKYFNSQDNFNSAKTQMLQYFHNQCTDPENLCRNLKLRVITEGYWTVYELHAALTLINFKSFKSFAQEFRSKLKIVGFVQGNMSARNVNELGKKIREIISSTCKPVLPGSLSFPELRAYKLPHGKSVLAVRNMTFGCKVSCISNYYQVGPELPYSLQLCDYFVSFMREPCFQMLREDNNLGYVVEVNMREIYSSSGIEITVLTQSDRFNGAEIMYHIDNFLQDFYFKWVKDLTQEEFDSDKLQFHYKQIGTPDSNWKEIVNETFQFAKDKSELQEKMLNEIKVEDMKAWYEKYLLQGKGNGDSKPSLIRLLSTQVLGTADAVYTVERIQRVSNGRENISERLRKAFKFQDKEKETPNPKLVVLLPEEGHIERDFCISNIVEFQRTLISFPSKVGRV